jgi:hypothetical protein
MRKSRTVNYSNKIYRKHSCMKNDFKKSEMSKDEMKGSDGEKVMYYNMSVPGISAQDYVSAMKKATEQLATLQQREARQREEIMQLKRRTTELLNEQERQSVAHQAMEKQFARTLSENRQCQEHIEAMDLALESVRDRIQGIEAGRQENQWRQDAQSRMASVQRWVGQVRYLLLYDHGPYWMTTKQPHLVPEDIPIEIEMAPQVSNRETESADERRAEGLLWREKLQQHQLALQHSLRQLNASLSQLVFHKSEPKERLATAGWTEQLSFLQFLTSSFYTKTSPNAALTTTPTRHVEEGIVSEVYICPSVAKLRAAYLALKPHILATRFIQDKSDASNRAGPGGCERKEPSLPMWTTSFWQHLGSKILQALSLPSKTLSPTTFISNPFSSRNRYQSYLFGTGCYQRTSSPSPVSAPHETSG